MLCFSAAVFVSLLTSSVKMGVVFLPAAATVLLIYATIDLSSCQQGEQFSKLGTSTTIKTRFGIPGSQLLSDIQTFLAGNQLYDI